MYTAAPSVVEKVFFELVSLIIAICRTNAVQGYQIILTAPPSVFPYFGGVWPKGSEFWVL